MAINPGIVENLRRIVEIKRLNISDTTLGEIADALQKLPDANRSIVKLTIGFKDYILKEAIDTGDVDFWIDQIVEILKKK